MTPNKFLQVDEIVLLCFLLSEKPRHHTPAAEERHWPVKFNLIKEWPDE